MASTMARLWAAPPMLRSQIYQQALLGQERSMISAPTRRHAHVLSRAISGYHRPRIHIQLIIHAARRFQSSSPTSSTTAASPSSEAPAPPTQPPPQTKSRTRRFLTTALLTLTLFTAGLAMSAAPAAETVNGYVNPTSDAETLKLFNPSTPEAEEINEYIINHPLVKRLRGEETWSESRPHMRIPPAMRTHNLTAGTLMGTGKIEVPPLNFNDKNSDLPSMVSIVYLGPHLCGHPGTIHGGLLATLLDEGLARACFPALPNKVAVTASLKMDYRAPVPAGRFVVLKAETTKVDGRKAWSKGWIELLGDEDGEGTKLVEAEALFIEPKHMQNTVKNIISAD